LVLEDSGLFRVEKYTDPKAALSNFKPDVYDLVLLDIELPNVDSFELYDKMKRIDKKLKVCFIGIYDNEESHQALRDRFPSLEPECFMSKEVMINDLIRRVNAQLEG
jgi:two-component system catabolic regulation response regulator CreB/two-component system response regulator ChvI